MHALMVEFEKSQKVPETVEQNLKEEVIVRYEVTSSTICYTVIFPNEFLTTNTRDYGVLLIGKSGFSF